MLIRKCAHWWLIFGVHSALFCARAQAPLPSPSPAEKWNLFVSETMSPMTLATAIPETTAAQIKNYAPDYGRHLRAGVFFERFAATVGDETSRSFFADFALASAFHEDTRYIRAGPSHGIWHRIGYAVSRAVVTRTDSGAATFNWADLVGCAMSAGLSNAYYPAASRTISITAINWATNIGGAALTNLKPEFGPGMGRWFKRHVLRR